MKKKKNHSSVSKKKMSEGLQQLSQESMNTHKPSGESVEETILYLLLNLALVLFSLLLTDELQSLFHLEAGRREQQIDQS